MAHEVVGNIISFVPYVGDVLAMALDSMVNYDMSDYETVVRCAAGTSAERELESDETSTRLCSCAGRQADRRDWKRHG
jgi:hypothetical protein